MHELATGVHETNKHIYRQYTGDHKIQHWINVNIILYSKFIIIFDTYVRYKQQFYTCFSSSSNVA